MADSAKELLIEIRAILDGAGLAQATRAVGDLDAAAVEAGDSGLAEAQQAVVDVEEAATTAAEDGLAQAAEAVKVVGERAQEAADRGMAAAEEKLRDLDSAAGDLSSGGGVDAGSLMGDLSDAQKMNLALKVVGLATAAVAGLVATFANGVRGAAEFADGVSKVAKATDTDAQAVLSIVAALQAMKLEGEQAVPVLGSLRQALSGVNDEGNETTGAINELGLDLQELQGMRPEAAAQALARALQEVEDPARRAALTARLFGTEARLMEQALGNAGAYETAKAQLGSLALVIDGNAEAFGGFAKEWQALGNLKVEQFWGGFASAFTPDVMEATDSLKELNDWLNKIDFTAHGMALAELLREAKGAAEFLLGPFIQLSGYLDELTGKAGTLKNAFVNAVPGGALTNLFGSAYESELERAKQQLAEMKARADEVKISAGAAGSALTSVSVEQIAAVNARADEIMSRVEDEGTSRVRQEGERAVQRIELTEAQLNAATAQVAAAMAEANANGVSPALAALQQGVLEGFARLVAEINAAAAAIQAASAADAERMAAAVREVGQDAGRNGELMAQGLGSARAALAAAESRLQAQINSISSRG
jgi:hypothetical protein